MPLYNYQCLNCLAAAERIKGTALIDAEMWEVIFETSHAMEPTELELVRATECPRCGGHHVEKTLQGVQLAACYVRGNGYLDRAGCHRDMHLHTLKTDDPYAEHRVPGEVDDIEARLKRAGQHNPRTQYFPPSP